MSNYTDEWARFVRANPHTFKFATEAHHLLGDISREEGGFIQIDTTATDDDNYYGNWLTGLGLVGVRFPKATTRDLTTAQVKWLAEHPVVIA